MLDRYKNNKIIFVIICTIVITMIFDTSIAKLYRFIYGQVFSASNIEQSIKWNIAAFIAIAIVYAVGQYFVLGFVNSKSKVIMGTKHAHLNVIHKLVSIAQYALVALIVFIILQMTITSSYFVVILSTAIEISYTLSIIILAFLAQQFFSWFKSDRNSVVLLYGLAAAALSINAGFTLLYVVDLFTNQPTAIQPHILHTSASPSSASTFNLAYVISSVLSFLVTWIATAFLLRHYSKRLGRTVYWIIVSVPLVYFLGQFQPLFLNLFSAYRLSDPVTFGIIYTLVFNLSKSLGGVMFGIAFWSVARGIHQGQVREYMIISAYGLVLLFTSNQGIILVNLDYPPLGLATISFVGLSSYLILVGIYSAAISIAQDVKLRQTIKKIAIKESRLLDSIGFAEVERQIVQNVLSTIKQNQENMKYETGIDTSLDENDVTNYLLEAIKETKT
jgi:hypothetical protein